MKTISNFHTVHKKVFGEGAGIVIEIHPETNDEISEEYVKKNLSQHGVIISNEKHDWFADGFPPEIKKKGKKQKEIHVNKKDIVL